MELFDCAFPLLAGIDITDDAKAAFDGANIALLVGARPRTKGMERADLLEANGGIFKPQGEAINAGAADDMKVLVVGNPANTNALIAHEQRRRRPARALHRDDPAGPQPRDRPARGQDRRRRVGHHQHDGLGQPLARRCTPTCSTPRSAGATRPGTRSTTSSGSQTTYIPRVGKRGAEIIEARGASSAASAANAAIDHVHDWVHGTPEGDWVSMAVPSDGSYGVAEGIISSFPVTCSGGEYSIVEGLEVPDFSQQRIDKTVNELQEEREAVEKLGLVDVNGRSSGRPVPFTTSESHSPRACQPRPDFVTLPSSARVGHHAVQVVLLDPHRLGELGDGDAGTRLHQLQRLDGAGAAAARAAAPAGAGAAAAAPRARGRRRRRWRCARRRCCRHPRARARRPRGGCTPRPAA